MHEDLASAPAPNARDEPIVGWDDVVAFLARPETHGLTEPVVRIDTHIAVVFLAGHLAYKIKRPVRFPFLDFSSPAARETACRREIAVDRPIAPEIYRRAVPITREADGSLAIGGAGTPVEWAVEMNRFDENATLDRRLETGPLDPAFVDDLAATIARAQARARVRDAGEWAADLASYVEQNADAFVDRPDLFPPHRAERFARACRERLADLADLIEDRGRLGRIRLAHGDMHCANVAVIDGRPLLFDAIEFDDRIATGDVLYDVGFLIMDVCARGDREGARRLLDRFLLETVRLESRGPRLVDVEELFLTEIDGLAALPLYLAVRAALRAKISAATARHLDADHRPFAEANARRFFAAALDYVEPARPRLVAVGGLSGSGKSTLARALAADLAPAPGAMVLRSDEIRKLVAGVGDTVRLGAEHYTRDASDRVYRLLLAAAAAALAAGRSVVTDAVSLHPEERDRFAAIARASEADFTGLWLDVAPEVAAARVAARTGDASDADARVVAFQAGLDPGAIDWPRIDASGTPAETLAAARALMPSPRNDEGAAERTAAPRSDARLTATVH